MKHTKEEILRFLEYKRTRGVFIWKDHWVPEIRTKLIGKIAGGLNVNGYRTILVNGQRAYAHRLVWFVEHGEWPKELDHIDGDITNNKITNLRSVTRRRNHQNMKRHREGRLVGASWNKQAGRWWSQIQIKGRAVFLGAYDTELKAHRAYLNKLRSL